jgi:hypothetical protein
MAEELSDAGLHFGEAFCVPEEKQGLPLAALTPDEQACALRVGLNFQRRVDEALGAVPPGEGPAFEVSGPAGHTVARLTMDGAGNVLLCVPDRSCAVVGQGVEAAVAAENTLGLLGLTVASSPEANS